MPKEFNRIEFNNTYGQTTYKNPEKMRYDLDWNWLMGFWKEVLNIYF